MVIDLYFRKLTLGAAWEIDWRTSKGRHSETLKLHSRKKIVKTLNGLEAARRTFGKWTDKTSWVWLLREEKSETTLWRSWWKPENKAQLSRDKYWNASLKNSHWRRKWQPTPVFLPGISHGQRIVVGYSPWGCKRVKHNLAPEHTHVDVYKFWIILWLLLNSVTCSLK